MYSEGVLFLVFTIEMEHLQAIGFSLSEQSQKLLKLILNTSNKRGEKKFIYLVLFDNILW